MASEDAHNALKAYEAASQSLDLTKAQILKVLLYYCFKKTSFFSNISLDNCDLFYVSYIPADLLVQLFKE